MGNTFPVPYILNKSSFHIRIHIRAGNRYVGTYIKNIMYNIHKFQIKTTFK